MKKKKVEVCRFGFFLKWHINCREFFFNAEAIYLQEQQWCYLTQSSGDIFPEDIFPEDIFPEDIFPEDIFPEDICPKVHVIAWLEFGIASYNYTVHRCCHFTTITPLRRFGLVNHISAFVGYLIPKPSVSKYGSI